MSTVLKTIGYSGTYQTLKVTQAFGSTMTAYLWGAGGGGGPGDGWHGIGGTGGGGGYAKVTFNVKPNDVVGIAVGQYGTRGVGGSGYGGGAAGASYNALVWDSKSLLSLPGVVRYTNGAYCAFLNQYGVWNTDISSAVFDRTVSVYFPESGNYNFTGSCDNYAYFYIDGNQVLFSPDYHYSSTSIAYVTAGYHNLRIYGINTGAPGCVGLTITGYSASYSGGVGGNPGGGGSSGGGGGGGGATVLTLNGAVIGVAGGGGGGGGAGQWSFDPAQCNAPGANARSATDSSGQAGENFYGDGGGGAGGGGGYRGGNGGAVRGGEATGWGGSYGSSYSINGSTENPNGRLPGGYSNSLRPTDAGLGGIAYNPFVGTVNTNGNSGAAVFEFNIIGSFLNTGSLWQPIRDIYLRHNNQWNVVKNIFTNINGEWKNVVSSTTNLPPFVSQTSNFGVAYRPWD